MTIMTEKSIVPDGFFHYLGDLSDDPDHREKAKTAERIWVDARVVEIPEDQFWKSEAKELKFDLKNSQLKIIGRYAFDRCKLSEIEIPSSVEKIGSFAFNMASELTQCLFNDAKNSKLRVIGYKCFANCSKLSEIEIPSLVEEIGEIAFFQCESLERVRFLDPKNSKLKEIGKKCFSACERLSEIEIPSSVKNIRGSAFQLCNGLTRVRFNDIENSHLKKIRKSTFEGCVQISEIEIPPSVEKILQGAFRNCRSLQELGFNVTKSQLKKIGYLAFEGCYRLVQPDFPNSLEGIDSAAFRGCCFPAPLIFTVKQAELLGKEYEKVEGKEQKRDEIYKKMFAPGGTNVDAETFEVELVNADSDYQDALDHYLSLRVQSNVSHVLVHRDVHRIPPWTFSNSPTLKRVDLPSGLKSIGTIAFQNCQNLKFIRIPDSVEKIEKDAFTYTNIGAVMVGTESNLRELEFDKKTYDATDKLPLPLMRVSKEVSEGLHALLPELSELQYLAYMGLPCNTESTLQSSMEAELKDNPKALEENIHGMTALHIYLKCGHADIKVIKWMISKYPSAISIADEAGRYPIHYFCWSRRAKCDTMDTKIMKLLVRKSKGQVLDEDYEGRTPFNFAFGKHPWSSLQYLYSVEPVVPFGDEIESIRVLKKQYLEEILGTTSQPKSLDTFSPDQQNGWVKFLSGHIHSGSKDETKIVKMIEDEKTSKSTVEAFAYAIDADNRRALEFATPKIKEAFEGRLLFLKRYDITSAHVLHKSATCVVLEARDAKVGKYHEQLFDDNCKNESMNLEEFENFLVKHGFVKSTEDGDADKDEVKERFGKIDVDESKSISKDEFLSFCMSELGDRMVLKFMKNLDQLKNEIHSRKVIKKHVIKVLRFHTPRETVDGLELQGDCLKAGDAIEDILGEQDVDLNELSEYKRFFSSSNTKEGSTSDDNEAVEEAKRYKYILVMTKGDRTLDSIFRSERPDIDVIRVLMEQVVQALVHFHQQKLIHADLKMLNVVRVSHTNRLKLIDFDASVRISESKSIASKFSSGILPPEAIYFLSKDKATREVMERIKFLQGKEGSKRVVVWDKSGEDAFLVKSAFNDKELCELLGEKPFEASEKLDVWAFGALLYCMCAGKKLFDVDRDDNIASFDVMTQLYMWDAFKISEKLLNVPNQGARELLRCILQRRPELRPSMKSIEDDDFFHQERNANFNTIEKHLTKIEKKIDVVIDKIDQIDRNLMRANNKIMDLIEGKTPSFIFVVPIEPVSQEANWWQTIKDKARITMKIKVVFVCPITFEIPTDKEGNYIGYRTKMPTDWIKKWGPRILTTLKVCQFALAVGRMSGLPIPRLEDVQEKVEKVTGNAIANAVGSVNENLPPSVSKNLSSVNEFMTKLAQDDAVKPLISGNDMFSTSIDLMSGETSVNDMVKEKISGLRQGVEDIPDKIDQALSRKISTEKRKMIEASSQEIKKIAKENDDEKFENCGLVPATHNGKTEFVHPNIKALYEEKGDACCRMPSKELVKEFERGRSKKEQEEKVKKEVEKYKAETKNIQKEKHEQTIQKHQQEIDKIKREHERELQELQKRDDESMQTTEECSRFICSLM